MQQGATAALRRLLGELPQAAQAAERRILQEGTTSSSSSSSSAQAADPQSPHHHTQDVGARSIRAGELLAAADNYR
jgi:hypothetical protein